MGSAIVPFNRPIFPKLTHMLGGVPERENPWDCCSRFFYRPDALSETELRLAVAQPTPLSLDEQTHLSHVSRQQ